MRIRTLRHMYVFTSYVAIRLGDRIRALFRKSRLRACAVDVSDYCACANELIQMNELVRAHAQFLLDRSRLQLSFSARKINGNARVRTLDLEL